MVTNPGDLSVSVPHLLSIRYERPLDLLVAAGFAPWIPLYDGESGSELSSLDPYVSAGGSALYFITKRFFLDAGIEWMHVFTRGFAEGGLLPSLSVGMLF